MRGVSQMAWTACQTYLFLFTIERQPASLSSLRQLLLKCSWKRRQIPALTPLSQPPTSKDESNASFVHRYTDNAHTIVVVKHSYCSRRVNDFSSWFNQDWQLRSTHREHFAVGKIMHQNYVSYVSSFKGLPVLFRFAVTLFGTICS